MHNHATPPFRIEPATVADVPLIFQFIKSLAAYERLAGMVVASEDLLREHLFGNPCIAEVILGYEKDKPVAFALYFHNFSTFLGRPGIYLEDLFVLPEHRRHGYGRMLLSHIAQIAVERQCGRFEWSVLDWNQPAIDFYKSLGAIPLDDWTTFRLTGEALTQLGTSGYAETSKNPIAGKGNIEAVHVKFRLLDHQ